MRRDGAPRGLGAILIALSLVAMAAVPSIASARRHVRHHKHVRHIRHRKHVRTAAPCANASVPASRASTRSMRAAVLCLVNQQRSARHLPGLHASAKLAASAQGWTRAMVAGDFFSHGSNFAARISAVGFVWSAAGENIATGYATPRGVVTAWMHSTGHCQNILNPTFGDVGTGVSAAAVRGFGTGGGTWTEDFALPMGQGAPSGNWGPANGCPY